MLFRHRLEFAASTPVKGFGPGTLELTFQELRQVLLTVFEFIFFSFKSFWWSIWRSLVLAIFLCKALFSSTNFQVFLINFYMKKSIANMCTVTFPCAGKNKMVKFWTKCKEQFWFSIIVKNDISSSQALGVVLTWSVWPKKP